MRSIWLAVLLLASALPSAMALDMSREPKSRNVDIEPRSVFIVDKKCVIASEAEFRIAVKNINPAIFKASDAALTAILTKINDARAKNKLFPFEATKMLVGYFANKGQLMVGLVMFDANGCVVPGTAQSIPLAVWAEFITSIGLTPADFTKDVGVEAMGA